MQHVLPPVSPTADIKPSVTTIRTKCCSCTRAQRPDPHLLLGVCLPPAVALAQQRLQESTKGGLYSSKRAAADLPEKQRRVPRTERSKQQRKCRQSGVTARGSRLETGHRMCFKCEYLRNSFCQHPGACQYRQRLLSIGCTRKTCMNRTALLYNRMRCGMRQTINGPILPPTRADR